MQRQRCLGQKAPGGNRFLLAWPRNAEVGTEARPRGDDIRGGQEHPGTASAREPTQPPKPRRARGRTRWLAPAGGTSWRRPPIGGAPPGRVRSSGTQRPCARRRHWDEANGPPPKTATPPCTPREAEQERVGDAQRRRDLRGRARPVSASPATSAASLASRGRSTRGAHMCHGLAQGMGAPGREAFVYALPVTVLAWPPVTALVCLPTTRSDVGVAGSGLRGPGSGACSSLVTAGSIVELSQGRGVGGGRKGGGGGCCESPF